MNIAPKNAHTNNKQFPTKPFQIGWGMHCANGHQVLLAVGYEATHTMPLGMQSHVAPEHYVGMTDDDAFAESAAMLRALEDVGALSAMAHSEEEDLSAQRIVDLELQAMEWYNPHGNFKTILGG